MQSIRLTPEGPDLGEHGLQDPASTSTYLVKENPFGDRFASMLGASGNIGFAAGAGLMWPLLMLYFFAERLFRSRRKDREGQSSDSG